MNQDLLFRTTAEQEFAQLNEATNEAYTLAPNDRLQLQLFSNRGQLLMAADGWLFGGRPKQQLHATAAAQRLHLSRGA